MADRSSVYSGRIGPGMVCCSSCRDSSLSIDDFDSDERQSLIREPSFVTEEERQALVESYREQLLTSSYYQGQALQDNDLEISMAT